MFQLINLFSLIYLIDFEYHCPPGENVEVLCMVAHELKTGKTYKYWQDELCAFDKPPFPICKNTLVVAYYASAEMNSFLALKWKLPELVFDVYSEFRNYTNGLSIEGGNGLLGALMFFGQEGLASSEKTGMRDLAIRGGPYSEQEKEQLLNYCTKDVMALKQVFFYSPQKLICTMR